VSITTDLLTGLATDLNTQGLATYTGGAGGNVFFKELPTSPDRCVALTAYATIDEPKIARSSIRVQFYFRGIAGAATDVDDLADDVFSWLQGREDFWYGSDLHVIQAFRVSAIQLGMDDNKRNERSDSYQFDCDLPITSGRPF
jgi:hypothetical protein